MESGDEVVGEEVARLRCLQWRYLDFLVSKLENSKRYTINSEIMAKLDEISALEEEIKDMRVRSAKIRYQKNVIALKGSGNSVERIHSLSRKVQLHRNRIRFKNSNTSITFSSPVVQLKRKLGGEGQIFSAESKKLFESLARFLKMKKERKRLEENTLTELNAKLAKLKQKHEFYKLYSTML